MARITAGVGCSHVPAIGVAMDTSNTNDAYWKPVFEGFNKSREWMKKQNPDVIFLVYNDHCTAFDASCIPTFALGCAAEFFAAMMPTLFFSMLGDAADYSEWKNGRRATGLIYSAGTFVQKTGGGFAGALVLVVLASYGYDGMDKSTVEASLPGMQLLMSWIPAAFAFASAALMIFYPLSSNKNQQISDDLVQRRALIEAT